MFIALGALFGALAVGCGAFGAHALKSVLSPEQIAVYQTAVDYQFIHSVLLVLIGILGRSEMTRLLKTSGWMVSTGMLLFSGSLYVLTLSGVRSFGIITPIGGVALIAGWLLLVVYAFRERYKA